MYGELKISDPMYPELLKKIPDPPKILYYKGSLKCDLFKNCIGIVGTRRMSKYGKQAVNHIISTIIPGRATIVSGFMYGVDYHAHLYALDYKFRTLAVMPCGVDIIHPIEQEGLHKEIINKGGLIISEYPMSFKPRKWTYVKRNRIVAGLSELLVVIEAPAGSGALITAQYSRKYERRVFAVPGELFNQNCAGNITLIKNGASVISSGEDINRELKLNSAGWSNAHNEVTLLDKKIKKLITNKGTAVNEVIESINCDSFRIISAISRLTVENEIFEKGGLYYASKDENNRYQRN